MLITTTAIDPSSRAPSSITARALAIAIRRHLSATRTNPASRVMLGACDDEYNAAGGVFRECSFTVTELLAALDSAGGDPVSMRFAGGSSTQFEIPDSFDIVQLTFWGSIPPGVSAD